MKSFLAGLLSLLLSCSLAFGNSMFFFDVGQGGTGGGPLCYVAVGPSGGVVSVASTNFSVYLGPGSSFSGSQTITIADGSQGGTITPSVGSPGTSTVTVTPPNGTYLFNFTYTPATTGTITLTFTNAQGWTNPTPLAYLSIPAPTTFDPSNVGNTIVLSNGNLTATIPLNGGSGGAYSMARSITNHSTGKYYFECAFPGIGAGGDVGIGTANSSSSLNNAVGQGFDANLSAGTYNNNTGLFINGSSVGTITTWVQGDTVGIAIDAGAKLIWQVVMHSGAVSNWNASGSANPSIGVGGISIAAITGPYYASCWLVDQTSHPVEQATANFGGATFQIETNGGTVPTGFSRNY